MPHTIREKSKLLHRVRRLRGQVSGVGRLVEEDADCEKVLQQIAACRGN
jgi:DNA-binding FrmR family transcriptional regulator